MSDIPSESPEVLAHAAEGTEEEDDPSSIICGFWAGP
jgi:hypothetical protein